MSDRGDQQPQWVVKTTYPKATEEPVMDEQRDTLPPSSPTSSPHAEEFAVFGDIVRQVVREELGGLDRRLQAVERSRALLPLVVSFVALGVSLANTVALMGGLTR